MSEALTMYAILDAAIGLVSVAIILVSNIQQRRRVTPVERLVRLGYTQEEIARLITYRRAVRDGFYTEQLDQSAGAWRFDRPPA